MTYTAFLSSALFAAAALSTLSAQASATFESPAFDAPTAAWRPSESRAWLSMAEATALQGTSPQAGWAVITEFMKDPTFVADTKGEWIEIHNNLPWRLNLEGWILADDGGSHHVITSSTFVICRPGDYLVLGNNSDPLQNGRVRVDYVWSGFSLSNTADQIVLLAPDGTLVDRVDYSSSAPWPSVPGKAACLRNNMRTAVANDDGANWCLASTPISAANPDTGTPGHDNDACP